MRNSQHSLLQLRTAEVMNELPDRIYRNTQKLLSFPGGHLEGRQWQHRELDLSRDTAQGGVKKSPVDAEPRCVNRGGPDTEMIITWPWSQVETADLEMTCTSELFRITDECSDGKNSNVSAGKGICRSITTDTHRHYDRSGTELLWLLRAVKFLAEAINPAHWVSRRQ